MPGIEERLRAEGDVQSIVKSRVVNLIGKLHGEGGDRVDRIGVTEISSPFGERSNPVLPIGNRNAVLIVNGDIDLALLAVFVLCLPRAKIGHQSGGRRATGDGRCHLDHHRLRTSCDRRATGGLRR